MMTIHLSEALESSLHALVREGRFASLDDAMAEAALLLVRQQAPAQRPSTSEEVDRLFLDLGLMSELPDLSTDLDDPEDETITIEGEPLSETIIRERR